ncbi:TetR/AcrR family transcriptional regulator [Neobacillus pocheonensis]|uniref:TetR/AcrR family transcriptional regulator n=1 Tax=Neobacillus pocheonensis TaxID=363869 RepID=A0ABT0WHZ6_9BACI|nr:TetR/AcrR family transcriptional regulator [Neobacillus pocheonensis]
MTSAKEKILKATFDCIAEKGSASISLRDISKKAGVSLSQIHYYFSGKEGLMVEAAAEFINKENVALKEYLKDTQEPLLRVYKMIDFMWDQYKRRLPVIKVYFDLLCMSIWNPSLGEKAKILHENLIKDILGEELSLGIVNPSLARFILVFTDGLGLQILHGTSEHELEEAIQEFKIAVKHLMKNKDN